MSDLEHLKTSLLAEISAAGDEAAMTEAQIRGMDVFFNKAECDACHLGFNFSDESFVNIGIGYAMVNLNLPNFDHVVTQWMAPSYREAGNEWISSQLQRTGLSTRPSIPKRSR